MPRLTLAMAVLLAVVGAACATGGSGAPPDGSNGPPHSDAAVLIGRRGGLCPNDDGDGAVCDRVLRLSEGSGRWDVSGSDLPDPPLEGDIAPPEVAELADWLTSVWDEVTARPFDGTCPTAHDGQEVFVEVWTYPAGPNAHLADADVQATSSCRHDWPAEFPDELAARLDERGLGAVL